MKCDELKARLAYFSEDDYERGTHKICAKVSDCGYDRKNDWWSYAFEDEVYLKSDVDNAITELKQNLEDAKATAYAESVDAGMENRRLKRALWLARANNAESQFLYWCARFGVESGFTKADIRGYSVNTKLRLRTIGEWIEKWKNVKSKCLAKAEEYK